jgi:hypothetical protein
VEVSSSTNGGKDATGVVTGVDMSSGSPQIEVGGQLYGLSQILSITPTSTSSSVSGTSSN